MKDDKIYLLHIKDAIKNIFDDTKMKSGIFFDSRTIRDAVIRNFQVVGEATKKVSADFKKRYQDLPWKEMAGMRDKITHEYFGINYRLVWDVIEKELPKVLSNIENILNDTK